MINAAWFVAGIVTPYLVYVAWWAASKAITEARRNFRPVVRGSDARRVEAVSVLLAPRFLRVRLPGHRAIYVRANVPTFGDPGYRVMAAISEAVDNEEARA